MRTLLDRFMQYVTFEPNTGCWLWTGALIPAGYGCMGDPTGEHSILLARRVSYELFVAPIGQARHPDMKRTGGAYVCHKCDVRWCVNPEHLFAGSHDENMADGVRKHRFKSGVDHPASKLTEQQVRDIRAACAAGGKQRDIAKEFGTTQTTVWGIKHRRVYAGIE